MLPVRKKTKTIKPKGYWNKIENRRKFFCDFAKAKGFDPNDPTSWANVTLSEVLETQGHGPISIYDGSLKKALKATFPNLEFKFKGKKTLNNTLSFFFCFSVFVFLCFGFSVVLIFC